MAWNEGLKGFTRGTLADFQISEFCINFSRFKKDLQDLVLTENETQDKSWWIMSKMRYECEIAKLSLSVVNEVLS